MLLEEGQDTWRNSKEALVHMKSESSVKAPGHDKSKNFLGALASKQPAILSLIEPHFSS